MSELPQTGYSWLGIAAKTKLNVPLSYLEKQHLEKECRFLERSSRTLEAKIMDYHELCKKYERVAGTKQGEKILKELEILKAEISQTSKQITRSLEDSFDVTHPE